MEYFGLKEGVFFAQGASRGSLLDTNSGKVYSINPSAVSVLTGTHSNPAYWAKLVDLGVAEPKLLPSALPQMPRLPGIGHPKSELHPPQKSVRYSFRRQIAYGHVLGPFVLKRATFVTVRSVLLGYQPVGARFVTHICSVVPARIAEYALVSAKLLASWSDPMTARAFLPQTSSAERIPETITHTLEQKRN